MSEKGSRAQDFDSRDYGLLSHDQGRAKLMADRKVELEKKRKKLEELRKAREQKKKEAVDKEVCAGEREEGSKSRSDRYMEAALSIQPL